MQLAKVIGTATATVKHPSLAGWRMLVVQPYGPDNLTPDGDPLLAVDNLGAGAGMTVIITSDGKSTQQLVKSEKTPVRWNVMGIADA
jgi:ethanolamine utilization protein EutN